MSGSNLDFTVLYCVVRRPEEEHPIPVTVGIATLLCLPQPYLLGGPYHSPSEIG